MKGYLSIGKVAKLKGVSIKSLRYYDEIGILKPAFINEQTNYRYYKEEQLMIIDAITLCLELGIPLKEFEKYRDASGALQLSSLLFDGKQLAEKKIRAMSQRLEALQNTLTMLENKETKTPVYRMEQLPKRVILLIPTNDSTSSQNHNQKLLELLVTAQKAGLQSSYPSGILYHHTKGMTKRFVFIHIVEDEAYARLCHTNTANLLSRSNCILIEIPKQEYACLGSDSPSIDRAEQIFQPLLSAREDYVLMELKNIEQTGSNPNGLYELMLCCAPSSIHLPK
ncbi:MAG: MerR family transcriptional regulator [Lachnospiraceae bacterium]|nr:MerR family transcriptional regulator [Lachnospiraceae bacterium]